MDTPINLSFHNNIATLTLNSQQRGNAIDLDMARAFQNAGQALDKDQKLSAIVIRSAGQVFCVGGDLFLFADQPEAASQNIDYIIEKFHRFLCILRKHSAPSIAVVNGSAGGGGLSLALACDIVIAVKSAKFACGWNQLNTSPDGGASYTFLHACGYRQAMEFLLFSQHFSAGYALEMGLVNAVVDDEYLEEALKGYLQKLDDVGPIAVKEVKALLRHSMGTFEEHLENEKQAFLRCSAAPTFHERITNFISDKARES